MVGLVTAVAMLAGLTLADDVNALGGLAGLATAVGTGALLDRALRAKHSVTLGPADRVTLLRAVLVAGVTALVITSFSGHSSVPVLVTGAAVALVLDAVDGRVARRTGTASTLGARFDMEIDAYLILVLSADVARSFGPWVLAIGAARYLLIGAQWIYPWLRASAPPRYWCKVVAAFQGIALTAAITRPGPLTAAAVALGLAVLVESFAREVWWLWLWREPNRDTARPRAVRLAHV